MKDVQLGQPGPPGAGSPATGTAGWRAVTRVLRSSLGDLANAVFPSDCRLCGAPMITLGNVRVCAACIEQITPRSAADIGPLCSRCGDPLGMESARFAASLGVTDCTPCRLAPPAFTRAVAFASYDRQLRELLHLLKFEGRRPLAEQLLAEGLAAAILELRDEASEHVLVLPVPLFAARQRERGFNQAELLARATIKRLRKFTPAWQLELNTRAFVRTKDTRTMFQLNPQQRRNNLRGAFRVVDPIAIKGREILLIDDIMTTGATARECSRVLLRAGATKVFVATVARAQMDAARVHSGPDVALWKPPESARVREPDIGQQRTF